MSGILNAFFTAVGDLAKSLGFSGVLWAAAGLLLIGLSLKFVERADRVFSVLERRWRRLPIWGKQLLGLIALLVFWKVIWRALPKGPGGLALLLGVGTVWWIGGLSHARRYGLTDTTATRAWRHHFTVSRDARRHTAALPDGTGKKGGRARKPVPTDTGKDFIVHPPHGMSDADTAESYNDGKMNSALADRLGLDAVQDVIAVPVGDGTVRVSVQHAQTKDDFFETTRPWWGMEKP